MPSTEVSLRFQAVCTCVTEAAAHDGDDPFQLRDLFRAAEQGPARSCDVSRVAGFLTVRSARCPRPEYFRSLRETVVPVLRTYPLLKIWWRLQHRRRVYSLAILLREEGLLKRSLIYATDINPHVLQKPLPVCMTSIESQPLRSRIASPAATLHCPITTRPHTARRVRQIAAEHIVFFRSQPQPPTACSPSAAGFLRNVLIYFNRDLQTGRSVCFGMRCAARDS